MTTLNTQVIADSPMAPESVDALDVPRSLLEELLLKILYFAGPLSVPDWGDLIRLKPLVVDELFRRLRKEQLCEVTGMAGSARLVGITSQGRSRALELLAQNQYSGPAPVSLKSYVRQVRSQSVLNAEVHPPA